MTNILYFYASDHLDSGSPRALVSFIECLDRSRFRPFFLANSSGPLIQALRERGVEIVKAAAGAVTYRKPLESMGRIFSHIARLRELRIGIVHINAFEWNLDVALAARMAGIPVVLHVHVPTDVARTNMNRFAASMVVFCSRYIMTSLGHPERLRCRMEILYNLVDVQRFRCARPIRSQLGFTSEDVVIGTVARLQHRKGIDLFLETARLLLRDHDHLRFVIAGGSGPGEEKFGQEMEALASEPPFRGRVQFLGSRTDIPEIMASLDLFFLPTRAEPFGIVIIEAMGAGVPVVASEVGGIPEIINSPDIGITVASLEPAQFASAIRTVIERPDRGRSMGERGRASLTGRFDPETLRQRLTQLYAYVSADQ